MTICTVGGQQGGVEYCKTCDKLQPMFWVGDFKAVCSSCKTVMLDAAELDMEMEEAGEQVLGSARWGGLI